MAALTSFSFRAANKPAERKEVIVAAWERAKAYTKEYLDAATEDVYSFKPTPEMRTFAEQMHHLAVDNYKITNAAVAGITTPPGFKDIEKTVDLNVMGEVNSPEENSRRVAALRKMLGTAPDPGTNTIIVTHGFSIMATLGKDWFDTKEGEASIFRSANGSYALLARVQMDEWPRIAAAK